MSDALVVDSIATQAKSNNIHEHLSITEHRNPREWRHKLIIILYWLFGSKSCVMIWGDD